MPDTGGKTPEQDVFLLIFRSFLPRRTLSDSNTCDIRASPQMKNDLPATKKLLMFLQAGHGGFWNSKR
jgi:hypothetical protein